MQEKMYSVAIRRRNNDKDHFWQHDDYEFIECMIDTCGGRYWYADPFVFEKDGVTYLFFEAFDLVQRRGKEGYCVLNEDGSCSAPKIVIDEPYHLSFPNIFEYKDDIYMMPEMSGDYSLKAYKAVSFPNQWEVTDVVLPDVYACDSIFIESDGNRYLLTNEMFHNVPNGQYASCYVKNYLYKMEGLKAIVDGVKVAEGDYGTRNAGNSFQEEGVLYRIGQDSRERMYGKGLVLFRINSFEPYSEEVLWGVICSEMDSHIKRETSNPLLGVHTYNFSEHYEIIDFSEMRDISYIIIIRRKIKKIKKLWKKSINLLLISSRIHTHLL